MEKTEKKYTPYQREVQFYKELRRLLKAEARKFDLDIDRPGALFARHTDEPPVKRIKLLVANLKPLIEKPTEDKKFGERLLAYLNASHARYAAMEIRKKPRPEKEDQITYSFLDDYEQAMLAGTPVLPALAEELLDTAQQRRNRVMDPRSNGKRDLTDISGLVKLQQTAHDEDEGADSKDKDKDNKNGKSKSQAKAPISVRIDWEDFDPLKEQLRHFLYQKGATSSTLGIEVGRLPSSSLIGNGRKIPHQWNALGDEIREKLHSFVTKHLRNVRGAHEQLNNILDQMRDATNYYRYVELQQQAETAKEEQKRKNRENALKSPTEGAGPYDKDEFNKLKIELRALVLPKGLKSLNALTSKYGKSNATPLTALIEPNIDRDPILNKALTPGACAFIEEILKGEHSGAEKEVIETKINQARGIFIRMRKVVDYESFNFKDNPGYQPSVTAAHASRQSHRERVAQSPRHGGRQI